MSDPKRARRLEQNRDYQRVHRDKKRKQLSHLEASKAELEERNAKLEQMLEAATKRSRGLPVEACEDSPVAVDRPKPREAESIEVVDRYPFQCDPLFGEHVPLEMDPCNDLFQEWPLNQALSEPDLHAPRPCQVTPHERSLNPVIYNAASQMLPHGRAIDSETQDQLFKWLQEPSATQAAERAGSLFNEAAETYCQAALLKQRAAESWMLLARQPATTQDAACCSMDTGCTEGLRPLEAKAITDASPSSC